MKMFMDGRGIGFPAFRPSYLYLHPNEWAWVPFDDWRFLVYGTPRRQKSYEGSGASCVGYIERIAEQAGIFDGQGFIPNRLESVKVPYLPLPGVFLDLPLLSPSLMAQSVKNRELLQSARNFLKGWLDPVDFMLTDPQGRRLGFVQGLGKINEIPNAFYDGDGTQEQFFIVDPIPGDYTVAFQGLGSEAIVAIGDLGSGFGFRERLNARQQFTRTLTVGLPKADAGLDQAVSPGQTVSLDASLSMDSQGGALVYDWELIRRPTGSNAQLSAESVVSPQFIADVEGEYEIRLVVRAGNRTSEPDSIVVQSWESFPEAKNAFVYGRIDAASYVEGSYGRLNASLLTKSTNPERSLYLQSWLNGIPQTTEEQLLGKWHAVSSRLTAGSYVWKVQAYSLSNRFRKSTMNAVASALGRVAKLEKKLAFEDDPVKAAEIRDLIATQRDKVVRLRAVYESEKRNVGGAIEIPFMVQ